MSPTAFFSRELFTFLKQLRDNNNRKWFLENKLRYERAVRDPLLAFIGAVGPRLGRISAHIVADPRPVGGSMFRIYRDVRFSKSKLPYKTAAAAQFRHRAGKDAHAPGYYLHLEPENVFLGVGLWRPDAATAKRIRERIVDDPEPWRRAIGTKAFRERFELVGEVLKRPPRGFDGDHPLIDDLKRKDFIAVEQLGETAAMRTDFLNRFVASARAARPFMAFLTGAVGLPF